MRIAITAMLLAASATSTALTVTQLPYYDDGADQPQPLVLATAGLWVLFALSLLALRGVSGRAAAALVLAGSAAIGGAALAGPPNTSTDSARYAWDGIVQAAGHSPYDYAPADYELAQLRPEWLFPKPVLDDSGEYECRGSRIMTVRLPEDGILCTAINRATVTTIYPPASELLFAAVRVVAGPSPQYWPMQLVGLLMSLAVTAVILRALISRGRDPRWAAMWGWCPLVVSEAVTNSHVDMFGALLLVLATLAASSRRPLIAGLGLGAAVSAKLIPAIGGFALIRRRPLTVILTSLAAFALLYLPYVIASGPRVLGFLPGYLDEEGFASGARFVLPSMVFPGLGATIAAVVLLAGLAVVTVWRADPDDPWTAQLVMIGATMVILSPRYAWYALLLVPMIAMTGRIEWLTIPLALTIRLLIPDALVSQIALTLAIAAVVAGAWWRAGPDGRSRLRRRMRHPLRRAVST